MDSEDGQHHEQQHPPAYWEALLTKSNVLSTEGRQYVTQFFANRASQQQLPIPPGGDATTGMWKVKLNEEKTIDPTTGESVKETLYLELDYRTYGYKKTRKVKRK